jgi:hypothetical protein
MLIILQVRPVTALTVFGIEGCTYPAGEMDAENE